jgi:hypothetical protein
MQASRRDWLRSYLGNETFPKMGEKSFYDTRNNISHLTGEG